MYNYKRGLDRLTESEAGHLHSGHLHTTEEPESVQMETPGASEQEAPVEQPHPAAECLKAALRVTGEGSPWHRKRESDVHRQLQPQDHTCSRRLELESASWPSPSTSAHLGS